MKNQDLSLLQPYCENDMKKLKRMSRSIFMRFNEPLTNADYDDFYSIANITLWQAYNSYDPDLGVNFEGFLHTCLQKKFKSELTKRHRQKRLLNQFTVSLDAVNTDDERTLYDTIPSNFNTFEETVKRQGKDQFQDKVQQYISKLSRQQVNILNLLLDGYKPKEIRRKLMMSEKRYTDELQIMRSYENIKILF
jgi:RNA polymerase sigma factor (sigma-70 family)